MRVLITGGTGFVGGWIARAVAAHGHDVHLLARRPVDNATIDFLGFTPEVVIGDIGDADAVRRALDGCDAVIHAAAEVALHRDEQAGLVARTETSTRNVLGQAVEAGLDPVVHVSSMGALWNATEPTVRPDLPVHGGPDAYGQAKAAADRYARRLADDGAPVTIVYPTAVMGPPAHGRFGEAGDAVITLITAGVVGRTAGLTLVDVRDLAEVFALVLEAGRGPRRYVAGGHRIGESELARTLTVVTGRRIPYLPIPNTLMRLAGRLGDRFGQLVPASLHQLSEAAIGYLLHAPIPDSSAVEAEFGVAFRPPIETLAAVWEEHP